MNEIINQLKDYLVEELTNVRGKQWKTDVENDMFHFYSGYAMALRETLDEVCKLLGVAKELERKEMK